MIKFPSGPASSASTGADDTTARFTTGDAEAPRAPLQSVAQLRADARALDGRVAVYYPANWRGSPAGSRVCSHQGGGFSVQCGQYTIEYSAEETLLPALLAQTFPEKNPHAALAEEFDEFFDLLALLGVNPSDEQLAAAARPRSELNQVTPGGPEMPQPDQDFENEQPVGPEPGPDAAAEGSPAIVHMQRGPMDPRAAQLQERADLLNARWRGMERGSSEVLALVLETAELLVDTGRANEVAHWLNTWSDHLPQPGSNPWHDRFIVEFSRDPARAQAALAGRDGFKALPRPLLRGMRSAAGWHWTATKEAAELLPQLNLKGPMDEWNRQMRRVFGPESYQDLSVPYLRSHEIGRKKSQIEPVIEDYQKTLEDRLQRDQSNREQAPDRRSVVTSMRPLIAQTACNELLQLQIGLELADFHGSADLRFVKEAALSRLQAERAIQEEAKSREVAALAIAMHSAGYRDWAQVLTEYISCAIYRFEVMATTDTPNAAFQYLHSTVLNHAADFDVLRRGTRMNFLPPHIVSDPRYQAYLAQLYPEQVRAVRIAMPSP